MTTRRIILRNLSGASLEPTKKLTMLFLASRCAADGRICPDYNRLASELGVDASCVQETIAALILAGELEQVSWRNGTAVLRPAARYMRPTAEATA